MKRVSTIADIIELKAKIHKPYCVSAPEVSYGSYIYASVAFDAEAGLPHSICNSSGGYASNRRVCRVRTN